METDGGGWTLFFNYKHQPGESISLNENKLPVNLKSNSHMYLKNAGFSSRDVKDLRFFCTEIHNGLNKMWHFKTNNPEILSVAMDGNQLVLRDKSLESNYVDIKPPQSMIGKYSVVVDKSKLKEFKTGEKTDKGGFAFTPFSSPAYGANWTVKGNNPNMDIYECGSSHSSYVSGNISEHPQTVMTHHSIWFRGEPSTEQEARERYMDKY
jgi:hypothetical protein